MGLFGKKEKEIVYPFSGFEGQLLYKGKPAAGAKITRKYNQMDKDEFEETITADGEGRFRFESIAIEFNAPLISAVSYLSNQDILITYDDKDFDVWVGGKFEKDEYAEFGGKPEKLTCELTGDKRRVDIGKNVIVTNCQWNNN